MSSVWLITGVSSGLGRLLALRALKANHRVIGAVRSKAKSAAAVEQIIANGGQVIELDMTESRDSIVAKVRAAEAIYGQIDYLVNNAAYSLLGPFEDFTEKEIQLQYKTNVFGPLWTTQAVLPGMRARRAGLIVNVSSVGGQDSGPAGAAYGSSKFAVEGMSESLAKEVAEFGIRVLIVEPGAFRTNFLGAAHQPAKEPTGEYRDKVAGKALATFLSMDGKQAGDPAKAVENMFQVISGEGPGGRLKGKVLRLMLGRDALERIDRKTKGLLGDWEESRRLEEEAGTAVVE